jgi:hypothetical protein
VRAYKKNTIFGKLKREIIPKGTEDKMEESGKI